ncbi:hypothetical protein LCGC14_2275800, partial [marine sediment metagenome]
MKTCPYCKHAIKDNWYYCRNCNKPLIVNLEDGLERTLRFPYDESEYFHLDLEEEGQFYENIIIEDEEIDQKIKKIDGKKSLATVKIENISEAFLGFSTDESFIFFNLKSTLAQLGV